MIDKKLLLAILLACLALPMWSAGTPRKQLLDQGWRFIQQDVKGAEATDYNDRGWQSVDLPHDWSAQLAVDKDAPAGNDGGYYPTGIGWYRRTLVLDKVTAAQAVGNHAIKGRLWLYFEGVYENSTVYVNGQLAGGHHYGYSSFFCDITSLVRPGKNTIAVRVDNSHQKNCRWYSGSGIYRHVWLIHKPAVSIDNWGIQVTTPDLHTAVVRTTVCNTTAKAQQITVTTTLSTGERQAKEVTVPAQGTAVAEQIISVPGAKPWSPATPQLYQAHVALSSGDSEDVEFGFRTIVYFADRGLLLNGQPILLNGGCVHHDNGILGVASFDRAEWRKAELMKQAGYNAVRTSHNAPSEAFLTACDHLGLLVIDEAFDGWRDEKNKEDYHKWFDTDYKQDIEALVRRDRNHPSIFCWSIGNEVIERKKIEVVTTARRLREEVHRWDTTRPITSALASWDKQWEIYDPLAAQLDITGDNYMIHKAEDDHQRVPSRVMMQTESYPRDAFRNWRMTRDHSYIVGDFVWTAIDYLGESGIGRYWYEGDVPGEHFQRPLYPWHGAYCGDIDLTGVTKPIGHYRNLLWNDTERLYMAVREPDGWQGHGKISTGQWAVHPTWESWQWPGWEGRPIEVEVCSRYPQVRLYLNNQLIGEKTVDESTEYKAVFTLPYQSGTLRAEGLDDGAVKETTTIATPGAAAALRLTADRTAIHADRQDLSYILVEMTDKDGRLLSNDSTAVSFSVTGPCEILAVGNADIKDTTPYTALTHHLWKGRALVVLRSTGKRGRATLTAKAPGLSSARISIVAKLH